ncbi:hypothetical protein [Curtobacterium flaccumfaciens]
MLVRYQNGETVASVAASCHVARPTVYRALEVARKNIATA